MTGKEKCTGMNVVFRLIESLLKKQKQNFKVLYDNWFSSIPLCRGFSDYRVEANSGISISKWYNNKCVQLISNYCKPNSEMTVKRWDCKQKNVLKLAVPLLFKNIIKI